MWKENMPEVGETLESVYTDHEVTSRKCLQHVA